MAIVSTPGSPVGARNDGWQQAVRTAVRDGADLCRRLQLPSQYGPAAARAAGNFPVFAPLPFVAKMCPGDPHDPLLRQVLPLDEELQETAGYGVDPVGDRLAARQPGVLQKYNGRALLITTGACAVHCRYCFRRHFPYEEVPRSPQEWAAVCAQLATDGSLAEVILSGGDPLMLTDSRLADVAQQLAEIPHLRRLRVHTRLPIMIPQRVTANLVDWLRGTRLTPIVVVHANHPRELDESVGRALAQLVDAGIPLLNQAVLLRGVNDRLETLLELSRRLLDLRVMPYYLHQLDKVAGAAHFAVAEQRGRQLVEQLREQLPGYAVPRYVQELPGAPSKTRLA